MEEDFNPFPQREIERERANRKVYELWSRMSRALDILHSATDAGDYLGDLTTQLEAVEAAWATWGDVKAACETGWPKRGRR